MIIKNLWVKIFYILTHKFSNIKNNIYHIILLDIESFDNKEFNLLLLF